MATTHLEKPADLFDRDKDWDGLATFATDTTPGLRIAVVYGRRRQGKSHLLRRLAHATGGFYYQALEYEPALALRELGAELGTYLGVGAPLSFSDWGSAIDALARVARPGLTSALGTTPLGTVPLGGAGPPVPGVVVLDEFPYLLEKSPELPSVLQRVVDRSRDESWPAIRLVLCGSAVTVMAELLDGQGPLRGRVHGSFLIEPFDYLDAKDFWEISDPRLAFRVHAVVGGTAGYRELVRRAPADLSDFEPWLLEEVLSPTAALYREDEWLLGEQRGLEARSVYLSVLAAVASGNTQQRAIAAVLGRPATSIQHHLETLEHAGFITKDEDALRQRRPMYRVGEPIVRFHQVVRRPHAALFDDRQVELGWDSAREGFQSLVLGPHFEYLARSYVRRHAARLTGQPAIATSSAVLTGRDGQSEREIDVVVLGPRSGPKRKVVTAIGEAKLGVLGMSHLLRLEAIRNELTKVSSVQGAARAKLLLFSERGFDPEISEATAKREDVALLGIDDLYRA
jgi:AAA+ ATPase superfamily predicted ATPase